MANRAGEVVCVTGGSGYIGSWLVRFLLERGYTVHATIKDLNDEKETKHLLALEGAESRLLLFQIDLINYDSIVPAITGAVGVFHLASPCIVDQVKDPENQLLSPAIKGTMNVLTASKELGVKRVVVTTSVSAIIPSPNWPADRVKNEDCWTDIDYCKQKGVRSFLYLLYQNYTFPLSYFHFFFSAWLVFAFPLLLNIAYVVYVFWFLWHLD
uniref:Cinnamoyl-CoA reductase 1-like n=1 Tax=Nicotiana tabacum TaxID=4097 RepID=A0A1S3YXM1_TOBAC|nr:PREDICTED: cinnamoyl-CoA reductase 1-like [Nicotiana tabacum]